MLQIIKAAILQAFGEPLVVQDIKSPQLGTGEVRVRVAAAPGPHYAAEVLSGERKYLLDLPQAPGAGAVGQVLETGPDATRLQPGDWVLCDPTVRSRDDALTPDITLQGTSARGEGGLQLQRYYRHGSFAKEMITPTENVYRLGNIDPSTAAAWTALNAYLVPYGGLLSIELQAGETIVISGATGFYGSTAVAVALAMGAGTVVAPGRNKRVLQELRDRFGERVNPVSLTGVEETDIRNIREAAAGPIDCALDILPPSVESKVVRTAIMTVREYGRISLMGGVGMLGGNDLNLPYPWIMRNSITIKGQWMYQREAPQRIIPLAKSGLLPLDLFSITSFDLDHINEAVRHAAGEKGAFRLTVVDP